MRSGLPCLCCQQVTPMPAVFLQCLSLFKCHRRVQARVLVAPLPLPPARVARASRANIMPAQLSTMSFAESTCKARRQRQEFVAGRQHKPEWNAQQSEVKEGNNCTVPGAGAWAPLHGLIFARLQHNARHHLRLMACMGQGMPGISLGWQPQDMMPQHQSRLLQTNGP